MPATANISVTGSKLEIGIQFDIARDITDLTIEELKRQVHNAVADELQRSPEFAEAVRKLAIEKIVELTEKK